MEIKVTKTTHPAEKPDSSTLGFGKVFTDHMFIMDYSAEEGWHDARIVPFGPIALHPASTVLHYGVEIFEGLKAYRRADGKVQLFRPIENIRRMTRSAERLCLPQIPEEDAMQALTTFVTMEQDWTPSAPGTSLYIRPFMFGNDETLGVHAVKHATFVIILSPVGSYYKEGINPVGIMIEMSAPSAAARARQNAAATMLPATAPAKRRRSRAMHRCSGWTAWSASTSRKSAP